MPKRKLDLWWLLPAILGTLAVLLAVLGMAQPGAPLYHSLSLACIVLMLLIAHSYLIHS